MEQTEQASALPLISVIVPVYKVEGFLDRCIKSICDQTYENLEIILVDDGSPDNCPAMCDAWAQKDERIIVIHQENKGVSAARNAGMALMKGEYFGFIDSDDYVLPEYFEHLYELLVSNNADMSICKYLMIDTEELAVPADLLKARIRAGVYNSRVIMEQVFLVVVWGKLYRTEICSKHLFPENRRLSEDIVWLTYVLPDCGTVAVSNKKLYRYTRRSDSAAHEIQLELQEDKLIDSMEISLELYRHYKALGLPQQALRALYGSFDVLEKTLENGIYWKDKNHKVVNRLLRSQIQAIWQEEHLESIPIFRRIASGLFYYTVIRRLKLMLFWKSQWFRKRMLLK